MRVSELKPNNVIHFNLYGNHDRSRVVVEVTHDEVTIQYPDGAVRAYPVNFILREYSYYSVNGKKRRFTGV